MKRFWTNVTIDADRVGEQRLPAIERGDPVVMMVERQPGAAAHLDPGAIAQRDDAPLARRRLDAVGVGALR